jgi:putative transposase
LLFAGVARSYKHYLHVPTAKKKSRCQSSIMSHLHGPGTQALRRGRFSQQNGIYFITAVTDQRIPWFQDYSFARLICSIIGSPAGLSDAENLCWIVMPDHVHLLLQLGETTLQKELNQLKSRTARLLNREIGRSGRFWRPGFHDHALRKEESLRDVARYIVANPIRAGLSKRYGDYPFWNCVWL